jgi:hypothetical protein
LALWRSGPDEWPWLEESDDGADENKFAYELLANVHEALKALAVQSSAM